MQYNAKLILVQRWGGDLGWRLAVVVWSGDMHLEWGPTVATCGGDRGRRPRVATQGGYLEGEPELRPGVATRSGNLEW